MTTENVDELVTNEEKEWKIRKDPFGAPFGAGELDHKEEPKPIN